MPGLLRFNPRHHPCCVHDFSSHLDGIKPLPSSSLEPWWKITRKISIFIWLCHGRWTCLRSFLFESFHDGCCCCCCFWLKEVRMNITLAHYCQYCAYLIKVRQVKLTTRTRHTHLTFLLGSHVYHGTPFGFGIPKYVPELPRSMSKISA